MLFSVYNAVLTSYLAVDTLNFPYQTGELMNFLNVRACMTTGKYFCLCKQ